MNLSVCMTVVNDLDDDTRDALLERLQQYRDAGTDAQQAQRAAVADIRAEIEAEIAEVSRLAREQNADLFLPDEAPPPEPRSQFFTNPDEFDFQDTVADFYPLEERVQLSRRDSARVDPELLKWASDVWAGRPRRVQDAVLAERVPHPALMMGAESPIGRDQPVVLPDHVVTHMRDRHQNDGLTPEDVARIPDAMTRPRAVIFDKPGEALVILPALDDKGQPLGLALAKDMLSSGKVQVRVTRISSLYSVENSLRKIAAEMKKGSRVWLPLEEVRRVRDLLEGLKPPSTDQGRAIQTLRTTPANRAVPQRTAAVTVLSDGALRKFQAGDPTWRQATETLQLPTDLKSLTGIAFSRRQPLYASRSVVNAEDILAWARSQGFSNTLAADDLHVTIAYSREPLDGTAVPAAVPSVAIDGGAREVKRLGDEGAVVLAFDSPELQRRWQEYRDAGASWDYESYQPHVTITYQAGDLDLSRVEPYRGPIVLGPEEQEPLDDEANAQYRDDDGPSLARRQGRFTLRPFGAVAQTIEAIQDRYNRWKHAVEDVRAQGGTITEANDFYAAEERYWGKVGARIEDFQEEMQRFVEEVAKDRLTLGDVALYAYAQHAKERNAWIAARRASMPDGGSGMTNQDAQAYLDDARNAGLEPELQRHAATLRQWIQGTRDLLLAEGLIDQDEHAAWTGMFQHYVPLRGLEGAAERQGTGQGFNIRGAEGKRALGRRSEARNIIEQIVQDRTRAIIRAGKNEVLRSFAQFVLDNPSPNLWEVNAVENKPISTVDANGNRIIEERATVISDDRTVTLKDGGREIHIVVHDERLRSQLQNLHVENVGRVVGAFLWANRMLSRLYTSLSPVFTVLNGARDVQTATFGVIDELGFLAVPRMYAKLPGALYQAWRAEAGRPSVDYQLYRSTGGKTGFFDFKDVDRQAAELRTMLADAERSILHPVKLGHKLLAFIEGMNAGIENMTRFAAFQVARESGESVARAASIAKNLTVNFNRKGALTPQLSAWFLFFNPAVQGTARIVQALQSPKVVATLGAGMLGVAALALRNAGMGEDDDGVAWWDKIPDEIKERNLVIVLPPGSSEGEPVPGSKVGRYVKVPMPYGYNFFAVVANQLVDVWRNAQDPRRGRNAVSAGARAFEAFMGAWLPAPELGRSLENPQSALLLAVPDALGPVAQNVLNLNAFGRRMYPDDRYVENLPDSSKMFGNQAGTVWQEAAQGLNELTGGTPYQPGLLDLTPASLENLARGYGGGPVSFGLDLMNALYVRQHIARPDMDTRRLPFVKQLYGVIDAETDRMASGERMDDAAEKVDRIERAMREGSREDVRRMRAEYGRIAALGDVLKATRMQLSTLRKAELKVLADEKMSDAAKYIRLRTLNEKRRDVLQRFNRAYDAALLSTHRREQSERR